MANFEPKTFNASDINGGQKFNAEDGITPEAINAPIESVLLMQELATTQPQLIEDGGATSVSIDTTNNKFVFKNIKGEKGEKGEQGPQGDGAPSNMSQNVNKTIVVDGSVVNGNWNATFVLQQGGRQRPICTQYTDHTGAKAEMVATANSAKLKFVNGSTDPQSYMEIFEDRINFSKPITVQGNPVGGNSSGSGISYLYMLPISGYNNYQLFYVLPDDLSNVETIKIVYTYQDVYNQDYGMDEPEIKNKNITIYENGTKLSDKILNLAIDSYDSAQYYDIPVSWNATSSSGNPISDNVISLDFYYTTGQYGGKTTRILFEIKFK